MLVVGGSWCLGRWRRFLAQVAIRGAVEYQHIFYGIALIVVLQFLPEGLVSLPARLVNIGRAK